MIVTTKAYLGQTRNGNRRSELHLKALQISWRGYGREDSGGPTTGD